MPKIFSEEDKQGHREFLLKHGLEMIMKNGYKHVTVDHLIGEIGASKGYFYQLFDSKEDFFLEALAWQMEKIFQKLALAVQKGCTPGEIAQLYRKLFKNSLYFATYEDIEYVQQKISDEQWQSFRDYQEELFTKTLLLLGRDTQVCDPKIVSNLSALTFLLYNSRAKYLFADKIPDTTDILLRAFHSYIFDGQDE